MADKKEKKTYDFVARGCLRGNRGEAWEALRRSGENSYLEFKAEPENEYDPNAIKILVRGEAYGMAGYVGREFTEQIKKIMSKSYRIDILSVTREK